MGQQRIIVFDDERMVRPFTPVFDEKSIYDDDSWTNSESSLEISARKVRFNVEQNETHIQSTTLSKQEATDAFYTTQDIESMRRDAERQARTMRRKKSLGDCTHYHGLEPFSPAGKSLSKLYRNISKQAVLRKQYEVRKLGIVIGEVEISKAYKKSIRMLQDRIQVNNDRPGEETRAKCCANICINHARKRHPKMNHIGYRIRHARDLTNFHAKKRTTTAAGPNHATSSCFE
eukprot:CAMPEP_0116852944 /NCGR_PEP_ID=MMETSP0418-20121206/17603_1 /TAXON_ID=1158023 /ORGANISM="Astrosyne radiata, Strain 13vi08-1A" /LENGTH=231 /DNA_ID=CAMNT_0004485221 /DNA_START=21 /DNA_END=713 /DNA_ORIENTATION=+